MDRNPIVAEVVAALDKELSEVQLDELNAVRKVMAENGFKADDLATAKALCWRNSTLKGIAVKGISAGMFSPKKTA